MMMNMTELHKHSLKMYNKMAYSLKMYNNMVYIFKNVLQYGL